MTRTPSTKRGPRKPQNLADAVQERLDATPERLARARDAGQQAIRDGDRLRRILDPFDTMRANRVLAPHDPKLNDIRWLIGESLGVRTARPAGRLAGGRARSAWLDRIRASPGLAAVGGRAARPRQAAQRPRSKSVPTPGRSSRGSSSRAPGVRDCRGFIPELATPWRADTVVTDRLRVALDTLGELMGVTLGRGSGRR